MKGIKGSITRLTNSIKDKLPDSEDLFGYAGIKRELITSCLDESYGLLTELGNRKEKFEVVLLKRNLSNLIESANSFLENALHTNEESEQFNDFLNTIASIKHATQQTYLLVVENSIRSEATISRLKEELAELKVTLETYNTLKSELEQSKNITLDNVETIKLKLVEATSKEQSIDVYHDTAKEQFESIEAYYSDTTAWSSEVRLYKDNIEQQETEYTANTKKLTELQGELDLAQGAIETQQETLNNQQETSREQHIEIGKIISDANRASMAGSFETRRDDLKNKVRFTEFFMHAVLSVIAVISWYLLSDSGAGTAKFDPISFFSRFSVVAPLVWMAWISSKKVGYLTRIAEDYSYKLASAMAYEGYKKQAEEVDKALQYRLLEVSIENLGDNPVRLFNSKTNHASPLNEITDKLSRTVEAPFSKTLKDAPE